MSGGGQGTQTTTQTQSIPAWLQSAAQGYLGAAGQVSQLPYTPYQGQRVADLSPVQRQGIQGLSDLASGTPYMDAAQNQITDTLQGRYSNPFASQGVSVGPNPYMGDNPYFQGTLDKGASDIVRNYQRGTAADTTRMFNLSGAFGGSAHRQALADNERQLGDTLANYENQARQGQYDRSANLAESGLNRGLQAGQFNASLGSGAYEAERQRQMGAITGASSLYGAQGQGYLNALNAGDIERRQNQSLLDSAYGDFTDWRNYPEHQLGVFGNAMGNVMGRAGGSSTSTSELPPADRVSQGLGIAMLANSFGNSGKGGSGAGVR